MSARGTVFELTTPENVPLELEIAPLSDRVTALLVDLLLLFGALALLGVVAELLFAGRLRSSGGVAGAFIILVFFLVRNFYFAAAEIGWHGRTVGKKVLKLRVIARDGGPLTAEQVFARNLTRDLETFLPLSVLIAPDVLVPGSPFWVRAATFLWALVLTLLPTFNRQRARLGDLVAGTVVVRQPRTELLEDLAERSGAAQGGARYTFSREQLELYGIRELQVLEGVLRREPSEVKWKLLEQIAEKVQKKISWRPPLPATECESFLRDFYAAQRAHLERRLLFGERRERKVR